MQTANTAGHDEQQRPDQGQDLGPQELSKGTTVEQLRSLTRVPHTNTSQLQDFTV